MTLSLPSALAGQLELRSSVYKSRTELFLSHLTNLSHLLRDGVGEIRCHLTEEQVLEAVLLFRELPLVFFLEARSFLEVERFLSRPLSHQTAAGLKSLSLAGWMVFREIRLLLEHHRFSASHLSPFLHHVLEVFSEPLFLLGEPAKETAVS